MKLVEEDLTLLSDALVKSLKAIYDSTRPIPESVSEPAAIPAEGLGMAALPKLWSDVIDGSTKLASPNMMGHMDTAPHPAAALSDAIISALNNNLLFRELSPVASKIEENLIDDFRKRAGLSDTWTGTFASGGSIANLTALFAACGGFADTTGRNRVRLFISEATHASIKKSAAVLGLNTDQIIVVPGDDCGCMSTDTLESLLHKNKNYRNIVVAVLGTTIHGAVDNVNEIGRITEATGAWLHIDAIYGAALMFSETNKRHLDGLDAANSIVMGPQKWMYVPRVNAMVYIKNENIMDDRLGIDLPYSATGEPHRGRWGLQGSRRTDAVTLWILLQVIGTRKLGQWVDQSIATTQELNKLLVDDPDLSPTHEPDLNLQCFRFTQQLNDDEILKVHQKLTQVGGPWVSLSRWRGELVFRSVLLSPEIKIQHLKDLIKSVKQSLETS